MPVHDANRERALMVVNAATRTASHICVDVTVSSTQS